MANTSPPTDYETYCEIMNDLLEPIRQDDIDRNTLKRLYESKLLYLESIRVQCFRDMNKPQTKECFSQTDYQLIYQALEKTKVHLRDLIVLAVKESLNHAG